MALRIDSPLDQTVETSAMPGAEKTQVAETTLSRYPKRKREEVKYFESDEENSGDSETELVPVKKKAKTSNSRPLPKKKIFPFMKLPAELRNKIYEECLTNDDAIYITSKQRSFRRVAVRTTPSACTAISGYRRRTYYRWSHDRQRAEQVPGEGEAFKPLVPNILAVSKTIYDEAVHILYGQPITLTDTRALLDFTTMMTPKTAGMLRDITVLSWCDSRAQKSVNYPAMALLAAAGVVNLERLNLDCKLNYFWSWGYQQGREDDKPIARRVARKVYRDCYPWLYAVGIAKGDIYGALEVLRISDNNFGASTRREDDEDREKCLEVARETFESELKKLISK